MPLGPSGPKTVGSELQVPLSSTTAAPQVSIATHHGLLPDVGVRHETSFNCPFCPTPPISGSFVSTAGDHPSRAGLVAFGRSEYLNDAPSEDSAQVTTTIEILPALCFGASTVSLLDETTLISVPFVLPNSTYLTFVKFLPLRVTFVPPAIAPEDGDTDEIDGFGYVGPVAAAEEAYTARPLNRNSTSTVDLSTRLHP